MFTSITWAPPSTWLRATDKASSKFPALIRRANALEPVTLVRSPILTKLAPGNILSGSSPLNLGKWSLDRNLAGRVFGRYIGNGFDMVWRGTTTATNYIDKIMLQKVFNNSGHVLWRLIIFAKFIGQACIGVSRGIKGAFCASSST
jgi:hypothetical protein